MRNLAIAVLLAMLVWFATAIIRLERYRYASMLGICERRAEHAQFAPQRCRNTVETRTGALWHLVYGLRLL
jgi:hypothetical protein